MKEITIESKTLQLLSDKAEEISPFMTAEKFVKDWGSGQSSDVTMLEHLLILMGFEEIHPNSWVKID